MRLTAAIVSARAAAALSRGLRRGGGTALPGLVAERIDPDIIRTLASKLGHGSVLVTGTNGKTTTARLVRNVCEEAGLRVVANSEGSNMMRGVAAALAGAADWDGRMRGRKRRIGVFEVDEATMPIVARAVNPRAVLFSNLFRDQLDRYGEVETVAALWRKAVRDFPADLTLAINADDPAVASLSDAAVGTVILYGVEDTSQAGDALEHAADARWCYACGAELAYTTVFYGHLGHWRCPGCGRARPEPDVTVSSVTSQDGGMLVKLTIPDGEINVRIPLAGLYNAYNVAAAAALAVALGLERDVIERGLARFTAGFGRQERLAIDGREVQVILAKNPAGVNQVIRIITADPGSKHLAIFLNDGLADGRDISWIWDVDFEKLGEVSTLVVGGERSWDMALRLKYAGLGDHPHVEDDTVAALRESISATPEGGTLYVIPTYTAMLQVRNILGRWARRGAFWEGDRS
ncbi:MAG TPA: MurT ligase domain-containing protein [Dehalococcoidia bacterium]|nr:MurT ligase domain-containing protein [Dehalococcoidia bacterium]